MKATTDKKQLANLENMLRVSNRQLEDLHQELRELDAAQLTRFTGVTTDNSADVLKQSGGRFADLCGCLI